MITARKSGRMQLLGAQLPTHPSSRSLYQWCRMLVHRQYADERDKVYAALGLTANTLSIVPDYNAGIDEVCLDLTNKSLLAGDFSPLYDAQTPMVSSLQLTGLSHVPSVRSEHLQTQHSPLGGYESRRYSAGLSRPPHVNLLEPSSDSISGLDVGAISWVDTFADPLDDLVVGRGTPFESQLELAYPRVMCSCGQHLMYSTNSPPRYTGFKLAFWRTANFGFSPQQEDTPLYDKGLDFRVNIKRCFENRMLFTTKTGYIGLGSKWMQEQDKVVIFDGTETPFLLRKSLVRTMRLLGSLLATAP
jgi:hypothetical protein